MREEQRTMISGNTQCFNGSIPMVTHSIEVNVNENRIAANVEPRLLLVHFLREQAGLTGTHIGCGRDEQA
jgi:xanthine dehydrogenase iron-sulfur cluster and FAD-binding subunit A